MPVSSQSLQVKCGSSASAGRPTAFVQEDVKAVDMTSWKYAPYAGGLLILVVIVIYVSFAG